MVCLYFWSLWQEEEGKRTEKESWGKMRRQTAERQKRRGHCWLERKQVGFFWWCVNLVVLGQIQGEAGQLPLAKQPAHCMFHLGIVVSFLEAFKTPAGALSYRGQALRTTENMLCLFSGTSTDWGACGPLSTAVNLFTQKTGAMEARALPSLST